jgi:hypothetical protein
LELKGRRGFRSSIGGLTPPLALIAYPFSCPPPNCTIPSLNSLSRRNAFQSEEVFEYILTNVEFLDVIEEQELWLFENRCSHEGVFWSPIQAG